MANDAKKLFYWQHHINRWKSSGLSQRAYCTSAGLTFATFDYWRRQTRANVGKPGTAALTLVPIQVASPIPHATLKSPAGWEINLPYFAPADLAVLLEQLPWRHSPSKCGSVSKPSICGWA